MLSTAKDRSALQATRLRRFGLLAVAGDDARSFLHAQLTNDVEHLPAKQARLAGWCSAKGRLLASFVVIPRPDGFLLQLAADLGAPVARRLGMFVLRAKVKISDVDQRYGQLGLWGPQVHARLAELGLDPGQSPMGVAYDGDVIAVRLEQDRALVIAPRDELDRMEARLGAEAADENEWTLRDIRAGHALIEQATQDLFVPQMVNFEAVGGVDFKKGCYPGQEIVARAQYRGQIKRRMVRGRIAGQVDARPGADLYSDDFPGQASGTVVSVATVNGDRELLAVVPISSVEQRVNIRFAPAGPAIELLLLPYAT